MHTDRTSNLEQPHQESTRSPYNGSQQDSARIALDRTISFGDSTYRYVVAEGGWGELGEALVALDADRFFVVADTGLPEGVIHQVESTLGSAAPWQLAGVAASERDKILSTVGRLADLAIRAGATRRTVVVALGGGLIGNVAGLLASLLFRGVRLVHLPTTLLAASDSTLSLKQAVNAATTKNTLGCYYAPEFVWSDLDVLGRLPAPQVRHALCEAAKNVLAIVPQRYDEFMTLANPRAQYGPADLLAVIDLCVSAKTQVMASDPRERQTGLVLEYGHTVGHALELLSRGALPHGPAIGLGMLVAAEVSVLLGHLNRDDATRHEDILAAIGAPLKIPSDFSLEDILAYVKRDNKRGYLTTQASETEMVLLRTLGETIYVGELPLVPVPAKAIEAGVEVRLRR